VIIQNNDHSKSAIIKSNDRRAAIHERRLSGWESIQLAGMWGSRQGWSMPARLVTAHNPSACLGRLQVDFTFPTFDYYR
jgi:hypothetical protein